jgi:serine/threonine-protein kinase
MGGMGVVYEAVDEVLGRSVALKFSRARHQHPPINWQEEARAASRSIIPNVAQIYEYSDSVEGAFIAMELVRGRTLRDVIKDGPLEPVESRDASLRTGRRGGAGRVAAFGRNTGAPWISRARQQFAIGDSRARVRQGVLVPHVFGLARQATPPERIDLATGPADPRTLTMQRPGPRQRRVYMSPEQARGAKKWTHAPTCSRSARSSTSVSPAAAVSRHSTVSALLESGCPPIHRRRPALRADCRRRLDVIVRRLLEKDRNDRYASAAELAVDLRELSQGKPAEERGRTSKLLVAESAGGCLWAAASYGVPCAQPAESRAPQFNRPWCCRLKMRVLRTRPRLWTAWRGGLGNARAAFSDQFWGVPAADVRRYNVQTVQQAGRTFHADLAISGTVAAKPGRRVAGDPQRFRSIGQSRGSHPQRAPGGYAAGRQSSRSFAPDWRRCSTCRTTPRRNVQPVLSSYSRFVRRAATCAKPTGATT